MDSVNHPEALNRHDNLGPRRGHRSLRRPVSVGSSPGCITRRNLYPRTSEQHRHALRESRPTGHCETVADLEATRELTAGLGINLFGDGRWCFQFLIDIASLNLEGENAPHEVTLTYTAVNLPSSNLVDRTRDLSFKVPDTSGALTEKVFSFNGIVRLVKDGPLAFNISAGVSYFRLDGDIDQLGVFAVWVGGHAVLFSELYEVGVKLPSTDSLGYNIGWEVAFPLSERRTLFGDGRIWDGGKTETALVFDRVLSENVVASPLADIEAFLGLTPLQLDPGFTRILAGLRWRL